MVKQFALGLCGLLKKSKLSLVSVNCMVLQVNIWQSRRSGAYLVELLYVTDMRCCLTVSLCRIWGGGSGFLYLLSPLVISCGDSLFGGCGNSQS